MTARLRLRATVRVRERVSVQLWAPDLWRRDASSSDYVTRRRLRSLHVEGQKSPQPPLRRCELLEERRVEHLRRANRSRSYRVEALGGRSISSVLSEQLVSRQPIKEAKVEQVTVGLHKARHVLLARPDRLQCCQHRPYPSVLYGVRTRECTDFSVAASPLSFYAQL